VLVGVTLAANILGAVILVLARSHYLSSGRERVGSRYRAAARGQRRSRLSGATRGVRGRGAVLPIRVPDLATAARA